MRIRPEEVNGELETLDHRRARLSALLSSGLISNDLKFEMSRLLAEVEQRMWELNQNLMMNRLRMAA